MIIQNQDHYFSLERQNSGEKSRHFMSIDQSQICISLIQNILFRNVNSVENQENIAVVSKRQRRYSRRRLSPIQQKSQIIDSDEEVNLTQSPEPEHNQIKTQNNFLYQNALQVITKKNEIINQKSQNNEIINQKSSKEKETVKVTQQERERLLQNVLLLYPKPIDFNENYLQYKQGSIKIREGWAMKKNGYLFDKIFLVLTREKLIEYKNEKKDYPMNTYCFKYFKIELQLQQKQYFSLQYKGYSRIKDIQFKLTNDIEYIQWIKCLDNVIGRASNVQGVQLLDCEIERYMNEDVITESQFLEMAETGDLLLFETNNIAAKIQRVMTKGRYDHVAIVIRLSQDYVSVFDSNADTGVTFLEWSQFIDVNDLYSKVVMRKLRIQNRKEIEFKLFEFMHSVHGMKYSVTASKLFKQRSVSPKNKKENQDEGYFCSELVAKAFKKCSLLVNKKASSSYWPIDFTQEKDIQLVNGVFLDNEVTVILDKHCHK